MRTIRLKSCKIGPSISLEKTASYFQMKKSTIWREYVRLTGKHLEEILKRKCHGLCEVYLFEFGCITFVNFDEIEIQMFLEFFEGMVEAIDYSMVARYADTHTIEIEEDSTFKPWSGSPDSYPYDESVIPLFAAILAKSTALNKIEIDVDDNLDESGKYIEYLRRGRLRPSKKSLAVFISKFLKFEYESINNIRIFDRSVMGPDSMNYRELYDSLAEYYELYDRFDVIQSKISSLHSTMKAYNALSYRQTSNRIYMLEIFLLGLFPVVGVVRMIFDF